MFSQLGSQEDENKAILSPVPGIGSKASNYSSTSGSKSFCSCVPYEGIAGASFVTCPTCQGSGEIPQELEKQLVALIPYGDQRLKPRHTLAQHKLIGYRVHQGADSIKRKLSVFLAVLLCLLTSSLIVFFLFPRSVVVQPAGLNSSIVTFDEADIHLNITNILNISNSNYYPITVTQLTIEVLHLSLVVGQVSDHLLLHVHPLASEQMFYAVSNRIWDENTYKICTWLKTKVHHVLLHIQGTLTCSYLSHSEQLVFQSYEYVDCRGNMSVPHLLISHPP
ncbi:transmembrane protein 106A isoform X2 [Erinaceus europaeus]|uniref:Transmembrane protein 106A isoform X2 n=1 Tax=Erinaceus europaeus TaxID=9365 RepID=A0ABM3YED8_ERIEU|nr:transmembrane protein 106A isoform X2 [Erinaceus europaeus]